MAEDLDRIVPLRTDGDGIPLFCVHAISGSAYAYAGLARLLGSGRPVFGFEAPGFDNDRTPVRSLPDLADEYTRILREFRPRGEYRLLGWSLGGTLAFEMTKRLTQQGAEVSRLILVDATLPEPGPLPAEREILLGFLQDMTGATDDTPGLDAFFADVPEAADPDAVFEAVEKSGLVPEEFDAYLMGSQYDVFRAHLEGFRSMRPTGSHLGPSAHVLAGESPAAEMNWRPFLPGLTEYSVPGTHRSIWSGDGLAALGHIVRAILDGRNLP